MSRETLHDTSLGIIASSNQQGRNVYDPGAFYSLGSTTVGAGGVASVTFSSIPTGYKHLQLRLTAQTNRGTYGIDEINAVFNADNTNNYSTHILFGDGSAPQSGNYLSQNWAQLGTGFIGTTTGSTWGSMVVDIFDYTSASKAKTLRVLGGCSQNGLIGTINGRVGLSSSAWFNTSAAINSIVLTPTNGTTFSQHSKFALYGVK